MHIQVKTEVSLSVAFPSYLLRLSSIPNYKTHKFFLAWNFRSIYITCNKAFCTSLKIFLPQLLSLPIVLFVYVLPCFASELFLVEAFRLIFFSHKQIPFRFRFWSSSCLFKGRSAECNFTGWINFVLGLAQFSLCLSKSTMKTFEQKAF